MLKLFFNYLCILFTSVCLPAAVHAADPVPAVGASQSQAAQPAEVNALHAFLDEWHDDAAHSRLAYFDKLAKNGVYIGTDKTERWTRDEFKAWAKVPFERPSAWAFKAVKRNIGMSADKAWFWFDEQLATQMGICQASGVVHKTDKGFEIEHYQLSIAVPNELANQVVESIKKFEAAESKK
ncbi:nuclear transport factor 2 family protein [Undibacterium sp. Jales W-56]|uniref:nuclear transport factor 2 family protein n=1 Tax=Undibacterium sp. Jales W-56 TaxID=2897325 RepID=UPI0021D03A1A|nr:nuclear transport factor 2 family protein [Undibacterium sp. Jales W-56]MCU6432707.1 nuclear transport factor 2 family protein [Undibacterium sp. Jales W-56]